MSGYWLGDVSFAARHICRHPASVYVVGDVNFGHLYQVLSDFSTVLFFSLATDKQSVGETF